MSSMVGLNKGTMLPLLMVKESIKCLDIMTVEDFQSFIPFMTRCVAGDQDTWKSEQPVWWVDSVEFAFPMVKPHGISKEKYRRILRSIVFQCYNYHNEDNILSMCSKLASCSHLIRSRDNGDGTSSLFVGGKHYLTFQNRHKNYDQQPCVRIETPPKSHLRLLPLAKEVVREITNVYLCDNCDAEFTSQTDFTTHERLCYGWSEPEEPQPSTPSDLLGYLQLGAVGAVKPSPNKEPPKMILIQNLHFGFSSHFGQSLLLNKCKKDLVGNALKCVQQYELFCNASQRIGKSRDSYDLRTLFKSRNKHEWSHYHKYSFSRRERLDRYYKLKTERYLTLKSGLNAPSRALLSKVKPCSVMVSKWVPPPPFVPDVIDLCSSDDDC